jgi:hypothetical protein
MQVEFTSIGGRLTNNHRISITPRFKSDVSGYSLYFDTLIRHCYYKYKIITNKYTAQSQPVNLRLGDDQTPLSNATSASGSTHLNSRPNRVVSSYIYYEIHQ